MAKVDGPLLSLEARGKIADAIVFFPWKGRHVVRQWLKPANPQKTLQGYVRAVLRAIGKEVKIIQCISKGNTVDSKLYLGNVATCPAGMNWNAFHAQGLLKSFISGGTFAIALFTSMLAKYTANNSTALWDTAATGLGLADYAFPYGYTTPIVAGCQLYMGALAAYSNAASWGTQYTLDPASFANSDVTAFRTAHIA